MIMIQQSSVIYRGVLYTYDINLAGYIPRKIPRCNLRQAYQIECIPDRTPSLGPIMVLVLQHLNRLLKSLELSWLNLEMLLACLYRSKLPFPSHSLKPCKRSITPLPIAPLGIAAGILLRLVEDPAHQQRVDDHPACRKDESIMRIAGCTMLTQAGALVPEFPYLHLMQCADCTARRHCNAEAC